MAQRLSLWLRSRAHDTLAACIMVSLLIGAGPFYAFKAEAAQISGRSLMMSSNKPGEHDVTYTVQFAPGTVGPIGSIEIQFCGNSALLEDPCVAPYGLDALNANLVSQSGTTGYYMSPDSDVNRIILTQTPSGSIAGTASFTFENLVNPTDPESYYVKIFTYASNDASGSPIDFGALAFSINRGFDITAEVPPYLIFCSGVTISNFDCGSASGRQLNFGEFSPATSSMGQSQLVAATNAQAGYNIFVGGTTMTSGNNIIPAMTGQQSQVGTSQFGINLRANTIPDIGLDTVGPGTGNPTAPYNQVNSYRFVNNAAIATAPNAQDYRKYTVSYLINVSDDQAPGVYSTTLTYVAVANF